MKKCLKQKVYPVFMPKRAPRNDATGAKQLNNGAQLQTIVIYPENFKFISLSLSLYFKKLF